MLQPPPRTNEPRRSDTATADLRSSHRQSRAVLTGLRDVTNSIRQMRSLARDYIRHVCSHMEADIVSVGLRLPGPIKFGTFVDQIGSLYVTQEECYGYRDLSLRQASLDNKSGQKQL